jgi:hypothetical protein
MAAEPRLSRASPGEVRGQGEKPLLHIWSECYNLTRRVLAITDHSEQRLALAVERFGRVKPDRLEFIRKDFPFAYWENGMLFLTLDDSRKPITGDARAALAPKLRELELRRHPLASDTRHPLYRAQPERWLETLIREDVTRIDARLDPKFVYTQVFAVSAGAHGVLDILCATRSGRLAILELKASENINLPLQAAEYWLRIQRHLQQGDFPRCGYFPGVELQKAPPLVYLVAPALRFHPTTDVLLRYLVNPMEVLRVGLAESWRRGLRVVQRQ